MLNIGCFAIILVLPAFVDRCRHNGDQLGVWAFHVCRNPQLLDKELEYVARREL
jgi:hypothetical protein